MRQIAHFAVICLMLTSCSPGVITTTLGSNSWSLQADVDDALVDAKHLEFGRYPNPRGVERMTLTVTDDAKICAEAGDKAWCGGPLQGIPYLVVLNDARAIGFCIRVVDIFGNDVRSACTDEPLPEGLIPEEARTQRVVDDIANPQPEETPTNPRDDVMYGTSLVVDAVNASLAKIGLKTRVSMPQAATNLVDFEQGDIAVSNASCEDVLEYLDSEFSDDHEGTDDYIYDSRAIEECLDEGRCRVGQIVTRAMADACRALTSEVATFMATPDMQSNEAIETGIVGGGGHVVEELCDDENSEIESCVGSPLVLDLEGDGLQLQGLGKATFALFGQRAQNVGWLSGTDDALLAIDIDGDGQISSGRELFGESTGGFASDGFAALARHDANNDGVISAEDPIFGQLLAWLDDGDGRSAKSELVPLSALGIQSLSLSSERTSEVDPFGNELGLRGAATTTRGQVVPVFDVWFRIERR